MSQRHTLDDELLWQDDGHLTDIAVTSLADGQLELLPESAKAHATNCSGCAERVGQAALLSLDTSEALVPELAKQLEPEALPLRRPLPTMAITVALVLALLGVVPSLPILRALLVEAPGLLLHAIPTIVHSATVVFQSAANAGQLAVLWCGVAVLLMAAGLVVARLAPRYASKGEH